MDVDIRMEKFDDESKCNFCLQPPNPDYGDFFESKEFQLSVHQYCMFFASGLAQNGSDEEGFDGFLLCDILKEVKRGLRLKCKFCGKYGATIGCTVPTCTVKYHYPCGEENGTLEQFYDCFLAFCSRHKPTQDLTKVTSNNAITCAICLEHLGKENILKTPCCKGTFFHKECVKKHALSSGYFFKCPTCNNGEKFRSEMMKFGIHIPERDALWEDGNRFADLLEVYSRCDSKYCYCPRGREYSKTKGRWGLHRCETCGQSATHSFCALVKPVDFFQCEFCLMAENKTKFEKIIREKTKQCAVRLERTGKQNLGTDSCLSRKSQPENQYVRKRHITLSEELAAATRILKNPIKCHVRSPSPAQKPRREYWQEKLEAVNINPNLEESLHERFIGARKRHRFVTRKLSPVNYRDSLRRKFSKRQRLSSDIGDEKQSGKAIRYENESGKSLRLKCALHRYIEDALAGR